MLQEAVKFFIDPVVQIFIVGFILLRGKIFNKTVVYLIIFFFLVSIPITGILFKHLWKVKDSFQDNKIYDKAVVLSGGVDHRWYPQEKQRKKELDQEEYFIFNATAERFLTGIELALSGNIKSLYYGNYVRKSPKGSFDTSIIVKNFAKKKGLSQDRFIIYGDEVKNTLDEAEYFKSILNKSIKNKILLITSQSHMRRAVALFEKQGIDLDCYSVQKRIPLVRDLLDINNYIPGVRGLNFTKSAYYEFFGFLGYLFLGKL